MTDYEEVIELLQGLRERVTDIRAKEGWNLKQMAKEMNLSNGTVNSIERYPNKTLRMDTVYKILRYLQKYDADTDNGGPFTP